MRRPRRPEGRGSRRPRSQGGVPGREVVPGSCPPSVMVGHAGLGTSRRRTTLETAYPSQLGSEGTGHSACSEGPRPSHDGQKMRHPLYVTERGRAQPCSPTRPWAAPGFEKDLERVFLGEVRLKAEGPGATASGRARNKLRRKRGAVGGQPAPLTKAGPRKRSPKARRTEPESAARAGGVPRGGAAHDSPPAKCGHTWS